MTTTTTTTTTSSTYIYIYPNYTALQTHRTRPCFGRENIKLKKNRNSKSERTKVALISQ
jgi:hypothetical protein